MNLWWHIGILLGFGFVLSTSAQLVVRAALGIAKRAGLSNFTVGFLLLGIVTSTPEIFVALQSVLAGIPQLSAGNLLGGSILLLSFVMGSLVLIRGRVTLTRGFRWQDMISTCFVIAAPAFVLWDGAFTRGEGIFLIGCYGVHAMLIARDGKDGTHHRTVARWRGRWHSIGLLVLGVAGLAIASRMMVQSAGAIINTFGISPVVFGLFFLSFGTNLPELSLAIGSLKSKSEDVAVGDFLGSAAANTLILGVLGLLSPYTAFDSRRVGAALVLLVSVTAFFLWSFWTGRTLNRREGIGLLMFYAIFVAYELFG